MTVVEPVPPGDDRARMVEYLERHLVGPFGGPTELLDDAPHRRYLMGILFPTNAETEAELEEEEPEAAGGSAKDEVAEDPVTLANSWMPSSIGVSFFLSAGASLQCRVWGAKYEEEKDGRRKVWRREVLAERESPEVVRLDAPVKRGRPASPPVLRTSARLTSHWRPVPGGFIVTVVLMNARRAGNGRGEDAERQTDPSLCLYQVGLECTPLDGDIMEYPSVEALSRDEEDEELQLLHRRAKVFAIGHGCAAEWDEEPWTPGEARRARAVRSSLMPWRDVPALTHELAGDAAVLRIARLADPKANQARIFEEMRAFVARYHDWVAALPAVHTDVPPRLAAARQRILQRLEDMNASLLRGVAVLEKDSMVREAFRLANLAMLMQMRHAEADVAGTRRKRGEGVLVIGDYLASDRAWRPFQLAFMLLCLPSLASESDEDRATVELLWFPTGGGKTEAYLALAAFQIVLRRLRSGDRGAGTTIITRYTLRLLTAQQFQRASGLVCALELIRRAEQALMGSEPITIGLWVGQEQAPNDLATARALREEMLEQRQPTNKFQIDQCPWCGTEIVPTERMEDEGYYGVKVGNSNFTLFCPTDECVFHAALPISVVDEDLYRAPPTFLLATVDKFARLAWVEEAVAFFGGGRFEPPSLIIQDEMHLLSGPLGTTVAVYEGAVEALASYHGARPKILASTATIRNAGEQSKGLFGRKVRVFPPPGLSSDDSYFARVDASRPGRRYLGIMAQSHTPQTSMIHTAAALLQAPVELSFAGDATDGYRTLVAYHNSLRELGRTATLFRDDIPSRIEVIAADESRMRVIEEPDVVELTGNVHGDELVRILARLGLPSTDPDYVSALITTNMLSVGVDIPRLGLMLVNGQPKATSEYIQATSRVGRAQVPGLVVVLYNSTKPRDRSHYEGFQSYHSAFYRYVEPTSVTPFSLPSRERSLHAAFVILMRHGAGLASDDMAGDFDRDSAETRTAVDALLRRVRAVDPEEYEATRLHLERLCAEWAEKAKLAREKGQRLYYKPAGRQRESLLRDFGASGSGWQTLHSMRNVDRQCNVTVLGER